MYRKAVIAILAVAALILAAVTPATAAPHPKPFATTAPSKSFVVCQQRGGARSVGWSTLTAKKYLVGSGFCINGDSQELDFQDDGNLVDYDYATDAGGNLILVSQWSSHTTTQGVGKAFSMVLAKSGNISLFAGDDATVLWSTYGTNPPSGAGRIMHPNAGKNFTLKNVYMYPVQNTQTCPQSDHWVTQEKYINPPDLPDYQYIWARASLSPGANDTTKCDYFTPNGENPGTTK